MFGDTFEGVRSDGRAAGDEESLQQSTGVQVYRCTGVQVYTTGYFSDVKVYCLVQYVCTQPVISLQ